MKKQSPTCDVLFWATGPAAAAVLLVFAFYFWGRRIPLIRDYRVPTVIWALLVGIPMLVGNVSYNVLIATLVFRELPPFWNASGEFSPYFTTRLKYYRENNLFPRITMYLMLTINNFDPDHFDGLEG